MQLSSLFARLLSCILLTLLTNVHAENAPPAADPAVWGAYAELVDHRFKAPHEGWPGYEIVWSKPGQEIRESKLWFNSGDVEWTRLIRPGARAGELIATGTGEYNRTEKEWIGTIAADGSVSFALREGFLKAPYRVIATGGQLKLEQSGAPPFAFLPEKAGPAVAAAAAPAPTSASAEGSANALQAIDTPAAPAAGWGVLEQLPGKTWQLHNSGRWESDTTVLNYAWSADRNTITLSTGDGYTARQIGTYRADPSTGQLVSDTQDENGKPVQAPVTVAPDGAVTVQLSKKRRSITTIDNGNGALKRTIEKLTWGGDWEAIETAWYFDAHPGPEWGVFSKLTGYNWVLNHSTSLHFRWLPMSRTVEVSIYRLYSYDGGVNYTRREGHPLQLVSRGEGSEYQLFGAPVGLTLLEGDNGATQISGDNRYRFELLSSPDRLLLHSEKWVDGALKKVTGTFYREDQAQKNERLAGVKQYLAARADSERTDRWLAASAALGGALERANEVAAARVAQSGAELDATLNTLAIQARRERMDALAQQGSMERTGDQANRATGKQESTAQANTHPQAHQTSQATPAPATPTSTPTSTSTPTPTPTPTPAPAPAPKAKPAANPEAGSNTSYMACVVDEFPAKTSYISNTAKIIHYGDQQRWNEEFFRRFVAEHYRRDLAKLYARCSLDRNNQAGVERQIEVIRKVQTREGFTIIDADWSPSKQH